MLTEPSADASATALAKRLYSVPEAAAALGVSRSTLYSMQRAGLIRFGKILTRTVVGVDEVDRVAANATALDRGAA